jgi:zinc protease
MVELHWTEVDGVTTVWAETRRPLMAGLLFRAGRADETLATAGQTHLLEHMALSTLLNAPERQNGTVAGAFTLFSMMGSPDEISAFILGVCRALGSLPGDRLEAEKRVLAAEAAARPYNVCGNLLIWRYGAAGYGLTGLPEFGLRGARLAQLHALAAQRFTSDNAVLWLSGPPPAGLRLELPHGVKQPAPRSAPILTALPSWFVDDGSGGVAAAAIVPRVSAATVFSAIAARRLRERMRVEGALSYAPWISYDPLDAEAAHLVLYADSDKERRAELVDAFAELFEGLGEIDEAEVERVQKEALDAWTGPLAPPIEEQALAEVQRAAMDRIFGRDYESMEVLAAELESVTASDAAAFGRDVQSGALFALPGAAKLRPLMGVAAPPSTTQAVEGREILSIDAPVERLRLVHGPDGVSLRQPDGSHRTVRYAELGAALSYEDGCLHLIGADASGVVVEPTLWRDGPRVCGEIRERVPVHLLLDQGARPAGAIPKPTTTRWQRRRARLTTSWQWLRARLLPQLRLLALIGAAVLLVATALISPGLALALIVVYLLAIQMGNRR